MLPQVRKFWIVVWGIFSGGYYIFFFLIVGLFILYIVIETAVRKGINNSIIGSIS